MKKSNQTDSKKMKKTNKTDATESKDHEWSFKKIMKDIELFAHVQMKKQKEREEKILQENMILGQLGAKFGSSNKRSTEKEKRKPKDRVLKTTVGHFKNGVLNVKHMLNASSSRSNNITNHMVDISGKKMYKEGRKGC